MSQNIAKLENILGYKFQNLSLLERAVTHRSWAYEFITDGNEEKIREQQNESLEFVGDSVLGLAIAEQLYLRNPKSSEGDLTLMKHHLVSTNTLAKLAQDFNLGDFIRVGRGEEKTGGRRKQALLADALEAIIGAIFFDSGYISARAFVSRIFIEELKTATPKTSIDYKTLLQETLQAEKLAAPAYSVIKTEGPPHNRTFFVEAVWENGKVHGQGNSIKSAEMMAANEALKMLETLKTAKR
ncbi:MAG TPA: ribonuclease III [Pyrinomonadaceae bacterium]|nr:ribonuclease III [Pyrinomonadaceae bacterium]